MIIREILNKDYETNEEVASDFDYFNDAKDTLIWLHGMAVRPELSAKQKESIQSLIGRLNTDFTHYRKNFFKNLK